MATASEQLIPDETKEMVVEKTFDLLKSGEKEIELKDKFKKIVLVIGDTGNGKTIFTRWITGDNKLIAKETREYSGEYLIEDIDGTPNSGTITSDTIYPRLILDNDTNVPYYDCPGFNDTRSASNDIATTCFLKKIVDFVDGIKILFIINHPAVRKGVDRHSFKQLLKAGTNFIRNIEKFQNSIALVATKVETTPTNWNDNNVIENIADFLEEVKQGLIIQLESASEMERRSYEASIKLTSYFLKKERENYTHIGIFRRPDKSGTLNKMPLLVKEKNNIKRIIFQNLIFTDTAEDDFGYAVSLRSENVIGHIIEKINRCVWSSVDIILKDIKNYYSTLTDNIKRSIKSFGSVNSPSDSDQLSIEKQISHLKKSQKILSCFIKNVESALSPYKLAQEINSFIIKTNIDVSKSAISNIETQGKDFDFLQVVSEERLNTSPWSEIFRSVLDFLSDFWKKLQEDIDDAAANIRKHLNPLFDSIAQDLQNQIDEKIKILEFQEIFDELNNYSDSILGMVEKSKSKTAKSIKEILNIIYDATSYIMINAPNDKVQSIFEIETRLIFLESFCKKDYSSLSSTWIRPFENIVNHLSESKTWYTFLDSLYQIFSEYKIQKDKEKYNLSNTTNWDEAEGTQNTLVTKNNFQRFLQNISKYGIEKFECIKNISLTETKSEELNEVLYLTLKQQIRTQELESSLTVTGDYVILSKLKMNDSKNFLSFSSHINSGHFESAYIFASNTVFIDEDLIFPNSNLIIIAPKWEIIGHRKICLDGADGQPHSRKKASDGNDVGKDGEDGKPGLPGKPGGHFFGIGETFVNGKQLTISAIGGSGGSGQDGGNGRNGEDGENAVLPPMSSLPSHLDILSGINNIGDFSCKRVGGSIGGKPTKTNELGERFDSFEIKTELYADYIIFGNPGSTGGNGGHGGVGGEAGNSGCVNVHEINSKSGISKIFKPGIRGNDGRGGKKGQGGKCGNSLDVRFSIYDPNCFWKTFRYREKIYYEEKYKSVSNLTDGAKDGTDGANCTGLRCSEIKNIISEPFKIINKYKRYLIEQLKSRFKSGSVLSFYRKLNENCEITSVYNIVGLTDEFREIDQERTCSSIKSSLFTSIYQSMLSKILVHAKLVKSLGEDDMKVLKYLYATVYSQIVILKQKSQNNLIIDIREYLNMIKSDIETLKELKKQCKLTSLVSKCKEDYNYNVQKRIEEAQNLVTFQILPEFYAIQKQIENEISLLSEEIDRLEKDCKEKHCLMLKKKQLQDSLAQKQVLNSLLFMAKVVRFLCPFGALVGNVAETVISVVKTSDLNETAPNDTSFFQRFKKGVSSVKNAAANIFNDFLADPSNEKKIYQELLQDLLTMIEKFQNEKNNVNEKDLGLGEIKKSENDSTKKGKSGLCEQKSKGALLGKDRVNKIAEVRSLISDLKIDIKNETSKLDGFTAAIQGSEKKLLNLKQYRENIYNSVIPMIRNMNNDLIGETATMNLNSRIALNVTNWQVQRSLKNAQFQMKRLVQGFKAEENIIHCFDMLQETMTTLIKIYDRLENYTEQQTLVNCIADISSNFVNSTDVSDKRLAKALNELDLVLKSNLISMHYKVSMDAFNQWVFPFSPNYINDSMHPNKFRFERNIEKLVYDCVGHIQNMEKSVDAHKISVMKNDKCTHHGEFNSWEFSTEPFYVWKNENYKYLITRLLSGQEIVLESEVKKSPLNKDAIKFSSIEFHFKCKNECLKSEFDRLLKAFDLVAIHTGNSYYRYANKIYLITCDEQILSYSFEKNANGESVRTNVVYDKIKKGDLMLSPYTVWKLKLINSTGRSSFDALSPFKDFLDLELAGRGSYVMNHEPLKLPDEDYTVVETLNKYGQYVD